jgi:hypothetical protein
MVIFDSADIYIECATSLQDKIARIDAVIDALLTTALKSAARGTISEYSLNDGQTQIKSVYRSPKEVQAAIVAFEGIKQLYVNRLNGNMFRLMDSKNFTGGFNGR